MADLVTPDGFTLVIEGGVPVVRIPSASTSQLEGWSILNRATVVVVDGPGDEGFLLPRVAGDGDRDTAPDGWDEAVDAADSALAFLGDTEIRAKILND